MEFMDPAAQAFVNGTLIGGCQEISNLQGRGTPASQGCADHVKQQGRHWILGSVMLKYLAQMPGSS